MASRRKAVFDDMRRRAREELAVRSDDHTAIGTLGLAACGDDTKSPAAPATTPAVGTTAMVDNTTAMVDNTTAMVDNTTAMVDNTTAMNDGSTATTTGG